MTTRVKGKWMPSYDKQHERGTGRRYAFMPGRQSLRQIKKNLRNKCRWVLDSNDPAIKLAGARIIAAIRLEPDPEYSSLHLFCEAVDMHDQTGEHWDVCANYLMDKFDEIAARETIDATPAERDHRDPPKGGLLRALIQRALRARHETAAKTDEHQRTGDAAGQCATSEGHNPDPNDSTSAHTAEEDHP